MIRKEQLGTETVEETEQKAKVILQAFLDKNRRAIRAMRSLNQISDSDTRISSDERMFLERFIKTESEGQLYWFQSGFCTIGDEHEAFDQQNDQFLGIGSGKKVSVVKGLYFKFVLDGQHFECVDLDSGLSRKYFDEKSPGEQEKFMRRFAERRRTSGIFIGNPDTLPLGFTAFISDQGNSLRIEKLISYRSTDPRFFPAIF